MNEPNGHYIPDRTQEEIDTDIAQPNRKQPPHKPRLTFVEPKLVEVGELTDITSGMSFGPYELPPLP